MSTQKISKFELIDHGIENSQYFQGCGTTFTKFEYCTTGIGDNPAEALDDLLESVAQMGFDVDDLEQRIIASEGDNPALITDETGARQFPEEPSASEGAEDSDCHYHLSLRWNHAK